MSDLQLFDAAYTVIVCSKNVIYMAELERHGHSSCTVGAHESNTIFFVLSLSVYRSQPSTGSSSISLPKRPQRFHYLLNVNHVIFTVLNEFSNSNMHTFHLVTFVI